MLRLVLTCLLLLIGLAGAQAPRLSGEDLTLVHDDVQRQYYLYAPPGLEGNAPLVIALHGRGGTGPGMAMLTGFDAVAEQHGFIVAYPSGIEQQWNYVEGIEGYTNETSDIAFLRALVADIAARHAVDARRVYVAGFSNGGFMAQRLACAANDVFAAYASVGAAGFGGQPSVCGEPGPLPLLFIHGSADAVVPFQGMSQPTPRGPVTVLASVDQTMGFWADKLGCENDVDGGPLPRTGLSPDTEVTVLSFTGCPEGAELTIAVVLGGGHNWPGHPGWLPSNVAGRVSMDIDASDFIWRFFERHRLPLGPVL